MRIKRFVPIASAAALTAAATLLFGSGAAHAQLSVTVQNLAATPNAGGIGTTVDNIDEAETLLALGGAPEATASPTILNYNDAPGGFPAGTAEDDFAFEAIGAIDVIGGTSTTLTLYVATDDGFRLRRNGVVIGEVFGQTGNSNTTLPGITLSDGDILRLTMFERGGGEFVQLRRDASTGVFLGDPASGIAFVLITPGAAAPEPGTVTFLTLGLLGIAGRGAVALRRRRDS